MNIMNKLTLRSLKQNKRRTLVTIIGVVISVAMLTAVASISVSFMDLLKRQTIADEGEWHVTYEDVDSEKLEAIASDDNTEKVALSRNLGYAEFDENNKYHPYLFVKQYSDGGLEQFPITITDGRLPKAENEIILSEPVLNNGDKTYEIGDTITLDIGERISGDSEIEDSSLTQTHPLLIDANDDVKEHIANTTERTFDIVGTIEKPTWEPMNAPGYTVITYMDEKSLAAHESVNASVALNKVNKDTIKTTERFASEHHIASFNFNTNLLRYEGAIADDRMRATLYALTAIIMAIIIVGSVSLIYNAFAISVAERSKYLGMLASVGATKQQKRNSVFFEGMLIAIIGIPIGIIAGLGGIAVTFMYMNTLLDESFGLTEELQLVVTPGEIIVSVLVSLLTIFISTYIPAKRASRITPIEAIRQTQDVKLSRKKVKTNKLIRKLFGFEATIGLKNLKRNKRSYQAAVISIVISIILFLSVTYFTGNLKSTTEMAKDLHNYDMSVMLGYDDDDSFVKTVQDMDDVTDTNVMLKVNDIMAIVDETDMGERFRENCTPDEDDDCPYIVNLYALDDAEFKAYANETGAGNGDYNGAIVIDSYSYIDPDTGKRGEASSLNAEPGATISLVNHNWEKDETTPIDGIELAGLTDNMPLGVNPPHMVQLSMIISETTFEEFADGALQEFQHDPYLYVKSDDPIKTQENIENIENEKHHIQNYYEYIQSDKQMILLLSIFTYGFIALITAISIANILNTLSTSISLRTREFAMLKSVGMTPKGFRKMIRYESIFYGMKSLLYGLPISIGIMYLMYRAFSEGYNYPFSIPWISILAAIIAVFSIVGITMLYASSKVKKKNIIDALKQENI